MASNTGNNTSVLNQISLGIDAVGHGGIIVLCVALLPVIMYKQIKKRNPIYLKREIPYVAILARLVYSTVALLAYANVPASVELSCNLQLFVQYPVAWLAITNYVFLGIRYLLLRRLEIVKLQVQQNMSNEASFTNTAVDNDVEEDDDLSVDVSAEVTEMQAPVTKTTSSSGSKKLLHALRIVSSSWVLWVFLIVLALVWYAVAVGLYFGVGRGTCAPTKDIAFIVFAVYGIALAIVYVSTLVIDFITFVRQCCNLKKIFIEDDPYLFRYL